MSGPKGASAGADIPLDDSYQSDLRRHLLAATTPGGTGPAESAAKTMTSTFTQRRYRGPRGCGPVPKPEVDSAAPSHGRLGCHFAWLPSVSPSGPAGSYGHAAGKTTLVVEPA